MAKKRIFRGEDRTLTLRVTRGKDKEPFDLTSATRFAVFFRKESGIDLLEINSDPIPAIVASIVYQTVTYTAVVAGAAGNLIILVFDGVEDIDTVIDTWNTANPTNTVSQDGVGTTVPTAATIQLKGGEEAITPVQVVGNPVLGKVSVVLNETQTQQLRVANNQDFKMEIDMGLNPTGKRRLVLYQNSLDVLEGTI